MLKCDLELPVWFCFIFLEMKVTIWITLFLRSCAGQNFNAVQTVNNSFEENMKAYQKLALVWFRVVLIFFIYFKVFICFLQEQIWIVYSILFELVFICRKVQNDTFETVISLLKIRTTDFYLKTYFGVDFALFSRQKDFTNGIVWIRNTTQPYVFQSIS